MTLYGASDFAEMILFQGNDQAGASGPDRIRHRAGAHIWQTFLGDETFSTLSDNNDRMVINNNGDIYISKKLIVDGEGINVASLSITGTLVSASADELNYNDITTLGSFQASKTMTLDSSGVGLMATGTASSNCLRFFSNTIHRETINIWRPDDTKGLVISSDKTNGSTNKTYPLLELQSNITEDTVGGIPATEARLFNIDYNNHTFGFDDFDVYTSFRVGYTMSGLKTGYPCIIGRNTTADILCLAAGTSITQATSSCLYIVSDTVPKLLWNTDTYYSSGTWGSAPITLEKGNINLKCSNDLRVDSGTDIAIKMDSSRSANQVQMAFQLSTADRSDSTIGASIATLSNNMISFKPNNVERMRLTVEGHLCIGSTNSLAPLTVAGSKLLTITSVATNSYQYLLSSNIWTNLGGGPQSFSIGGYFASSVYVQSSIYTASDRRLKQDIKSLDFSLEHYDKLRPVSYRMKNEKHSKIGLVAQECSSVCGEMVSMIPNENMLIEEEGDLDGTQLSVDYSMLSTLNLVAIKKLIKAVNTLSAMLPKAKKEEFDKIMNV